jgi:hypothetical protein
MQANRGIDPAKVLERFAVARLSLLPAGSFDDAVAIIKRPARDVRRV